MSRRTLGKPQCPSYLKDLREAIDRFMPKVCLPLLSEDRRCRWVPRMLVLTAILMAWVGTAHLIDRFTEARGVVVKMFPGRRRPGVSYEGFVAALAKVSAALQEVLAEHWRGAVREIAGPFWKIGRWLIFGVDGSKLDCPRTAANEAGLGTSGKNNSGPQLLVTSLFHLGTGLLWNFRRGGLRGSGERTYLQQMMGSLPPEALLVADAGFTGYDLLKGLMDSGRHFILRVGANVKLLRKLGYAVREHRDIVYLWPDAKQGRNRHGRLAEDLAKVSPPLALRLIRLVDGRNRAVCLLTDLCCRRQLSDREAARIYGLRWGVEVAWRNLKQTMGRGTLDSQTPQNVQMELDWAMAGLWMLGLLSVSRLIESGQSPGCHSTAEVLRVLRQAMGAKLRGRASLGRRLAEAVKDTYQRTGSKTARHYPHKRRQKPPGEPLARNASAAEVRLAQRLREQEAVRKKAA